ncbi:MAG TPA: FHA domain-containing protein [Acidimicrobiales bacterium]|nr:FHA domain-containing protein [Acidimicrobiales bacterium]
MLSIEIPSARLVPVAGDSGWLCRLPSAVVWVPGSGDDAIELITTCAGADNAAQLLGRVASHLADPDGASWPPFAILAAKGRDLVAVVHGPVEVQVDHEAGVSKLYGGDEIGSWLNRLVKAPSGASCGEARGHLDPIADLREGVVRAGGFALVASGAGADAGLLPAEGARAVAGTASDVVLAGDHVASSAQAGSAQAGSAQPSSVMAGSGSSGSARGVARPATTVGYVPDFDEAAEVAESPTVAEPRAVSATDATIVEADAGLFTIGETASAARQPGRLGRLTWDNGEVNDLLGPVLLGRDVASDESVLAGRLTAIVPGGQNDSMSRVHAEITRRGDEIVVVDRGSTNGTFVWDEPAKAWQRLASGQAQAITPGTVLAFGERTATFEAPSR